MGSNPFVDPTRGKPDPESGHVRSERICSQDRRLGWRLHFRYEETTTHGNFRF